jgi:(1->4)-alpha-D-glucan 1-alpha-D-glucosylmutase
MLVTMRALALRQAQSEVFASGRYIPLAATGDAAEHLFAFARRLENRHVIVATPRHFHLLTHRNNGPNASPSPTSGHPPRADWGDARLILPPDSPRVWQCEFSGRTLEATDDDDTLNLAAADLFDVLPVALLSTIKKTATTQTASKDA